MMGDHLINAQLVDIDMMSISKMEVASLRAVTALLLRNKP